MAQLIRQSLAADRDRADRERALQRDYEQQKRMLEQLKSGQGQVPPGRDPPSYQEATSRDLAGQSTTSSVTSEGSDGTAPAVPPPPQPQPPELESRLKEVRDISTFMANIVYVCLILAECLF